MQELRVIGEWDIPDEDRVVYLDLSRIESIESMAGLVIDGTLYPACMVQMRSGGRFRIRETAEYVLSKATDTPLRQPVSAL